VEKLFEDLNHEFHRGKIVVEQNNLIERRLAERRQSHLRSQYMTGQVFSAHAPIVAQRSARWHAGIFLPGILRSEGNRWACILLYPQPLALMHKDSLPRMNPSRDACPAQPTLDPAGTPGSCREPGHPLLSQQVQEEAHGPISAHS